MPIKSLSCLKVAKHLGFLLLNSTQWASASCSTQAMFCFAWHLRSTEHWSSCEGSLTANARYQDLLTTTLRE